MMKKSHNASFLLLGDLTVTTAFPFKLHSNVLAGSLVDVDDQLEEVEDLMKGDPDEDDDCEDEYDKESDQWHVSVPK